MGRLSRSVLVVGFVWAAALSYSSAAADFEISIDRPLVVATKEAPPFVMKNDAGEWTGLSIELWRSVAERLDVEYELREMSIPEMLDTLEEGSVDVSAAAMTVTPDREERVDFIHPFHTTGLSIAIASDGGTSWIASLGAFFTAGFLRVVLALAAILLVCGLLVWLFERRVNEEMFGGSTARGIGSGFWWAAVTMTTVGYGDKAPVTIGGRIVALVWMFASLIVISGFTAAIASALTLGGLGSPISGPEDLDEVRTGSVPATTSASYLESEGVGYQRADDVASGLAALRDGRIDAFVYDRPILGHVARTRFAGEVRLLTGSFERQDYAFAVPPHSDLREPINRAVLDVVAGEGSREWKRQMERFLGKP